MTLPSEPSPQRPGRPDRATHAPDRLRRRVLAGVRSQPEPVSSRAADRIRRLLGTRGRGAAALLLVCAAAGLALVLVIALSGTSTLRRVHPPQGGSGAPRASLVRAGSRAELRIAGMAQPPVGEIYEVWLARADGIPRPTNALFTPTSAGTAAVEVPGSLRAVSAITVTAEPRGGSAHPTGPVIMRVALSGKGG